MPIGVVLNMVKLTWGMLHSELWAHFSSKTLLIESVLVTEKFDFIIRGGLQKGHYFSGSLIHGVIPKPTLAI
jgi:hypothetical protein